MHHIIDLHLETGPWYRNKRSCACTHNVLKAGFKPGAEICSQTHVPSLQMDADKHRTNRTFSHMVRSTRFKASTKKKKSRSAAIHHEKWLMRPAHWQTAWLPAVVRFLTLLKTEVCQWTQCHKKCSRQSLPSDVSAKLLPCQRDACNALGNTLGSWAVFTVASNDLASSKPVGKLNPGFCLEGKKFKGLQTGLWPDWEECSTGCLQEAFQTFP